MGNRVDEILSRRMVYTLLIVVAAASAAGRILASALNYDPATFRDPANSADKRKLWPAERPTPTPMFGSNDRSRWATVRALVDEGTFAVGQREPGHADAVNGFGDHGIVFEDGWITVDKVLHPDTQVFYSSKPPLLPTLAAGEYWLLKRVCGWAITDDRFLVARIILFTVNWLPLIVYLVLLSRLIDDYGRSDWGRLYVMVAACFGTLLTPFLIAFNNHSVATCCALFALYPALSILQDSGAPVAASERPRVFASHFLLAGFFAGFTMTMELPAAALVAGLFALLFHQAPGRTLCCFLPAAAVPVAALLLTNYLAIGELMPAYDKVDTPWYQYPGSHWYDPDKTKKGVDFIKESKLSYTFHFLLGHHGLFSLAPIYLLSIGGMIVGLRRLVSGSGDMNADDALRQPIAADGAAARFPAVLFALTAYLVVVVVGFYLWKTNNYGGGTSGPRWLMWLTPFLLLTMLPIADWLSARRWGRVLGYICLGVSVLSASYPALNPWRHPWIQTFMESQGWLSF